MAGLIIMGKRFSWNGENYGESLCSFCTISQIHTHVLLCYYEEGGRRQRYRKMITKKKKRSVCGVESRDDEKTEIKEKEDRKKVGSTTVHLAFFHFTVSKAHLISLLCTFFTSTKAYKKLDI